MPDELHVLIWDESDVAGFAVTRELERRGWRVHGRRVQELSAWRVALTEGHWDLAFCQASPALENCLNAIRQARAIRVDLPVIVLVDGWKEPDLRATLEAGACDWLRLGRLSRLVPVVERELAKRLPAPQPESREAGLGLLSRLAGELGQAADVESALGLVLREVCQAQGWSAGMAWGLDSDATIFSCLPIWHAAAPGLETFRKACESFRFGRETVWPERFWTQAEPCWLTDLAALADPLLASAAQVGLGSALLVPVMVQERLVAIWAFFAQRVRVEDASLTAAVRILARQAACLIQHREAEDRLRSGEQLFRQLSEHSPFGILLLDGQGCCHYSNPRAQAVLGVPAEDARGHGWLRGLTPEDRQGPWADWLSALGRQTEAACELRLERAHRLAWVRLRATSASETPGERRFVVAVDDITEKKQFDTEYLQARKMETVGRLAGGVAHDFNNLLTAINSFARLAQDSLPQDCQARTDIGMILKAAEKATQLTRRLLAFARREVAVPQILNPNTRLLDLEKMLRRLIREDIEFVVRAGTDCWPIQIDPNQFEQVLINLVVNARDAMPKGGTLRIETSNVEIQQPDAARGPRVKSGDYVLLAVHDTGVGMTEDVRMHVFEPFFTTKPQGKGTGLGLATVYGIVKQNGGHIEVLSQPHQGATFHLYFPRARTPEIAPSAGDPLAPGNLTGTETVLVVEDESDVRRLTERVLKSKGYQVVAAGNGEEALRFAERNRDRSVHLLLTDMVMPKMGGRVLAQRLRAQRPGLKVLYMSGYTEELLDVQKGIEPGTDFIHKPFTPQGLLEQLRALLDAKA
jgi:PAS domain S-box-containing protein